jgi:hypothetical protein
MLRRLAIVLWWVGFLIAVGSSLGALVAVAADRRMMDLLIAPVCWVFTAASWCLSFILGGSFWRPPSGKA